MATTTLERPGVLTLTAKAETATKRAWLEERKTYIGATDASAILGLNPYKSPHDVWLEKNGLATVEETIAMRHGIHVESFIAREYQRMTGAKVRRSKLYRHEKFPQFACNPDREVTISGHDAILECKSVGYWASKNFGQDGSDQIPQHYLIQVMWQLMVTGKTLVQLVALVDNRELRVYNYTLDPELSEFAHVFDMDTVRACAQECGRWWQRHMIEGVEPPMSGLPSDHEFLQSNRATYENGELVNTDEATDRLCVKLEGALKREARAAYVAAEYKNRIKQFMAKEKASALESSVGTFTWKTNVRGVAVFKTPFKTEKA